MKKQCTILTACLVAVALAGCADASTSISKSDEALVTIGDTKITKGEVYDVAKRTYGASFTLNEALNVISEKEEIKLTDEMKKSVEDQLKILKSSAGENFGQQLKDAGYKNEEEYKEKVLYPNTKQQGLVKKYVKNNKKSLFSSYSPRKAQKLEFTSKEDAQKTLEEIKNGKPIEEFTTVNTSSGTSQLEETYTTKSSLPAGAFDKIKAMEKPGLIEEVIEDTTSSKYYVFKVTQVDPNKFEDDAIDAIVSTGSSEITNASNVYWLDKYEFNVYDKDIYDGLKAIDEKYVD